MHPTWHAAADAHGGKHRPQVEALHQILKGHATPTARLHAAIDAGCAHLQAMKADGSTLEDVVEALGHLIDHAATLKSAIASGVE